MAVQHTIVRKVRRIRMKSAEEVAEDRRKEQAKQEKLAKQAENRRKSLQMMMQLQMEAAASGEAS